MAIQRMTVVLSSAPDTDEEADRIIGYLVEEYLQRAVVVLGWDIQEELPEDISVSLKDQLSAHKRDAGEGAVYMVVRLTEDG